MNNYSNTIYRGTIKQFVGIISINRENGDFEIISDDVIEYETLISGSGTVYLDVLHPDRILNTKDDYFMNYPLVSGDTSLYEVDKNSLVPVRNYAKPKGRTLKRTRR